MRIRELRLQKFMSHESTGLAFPERGIVCVTGPNGAGKSSVVEAVAMAFWGKTLRGAPPWAETVGDAEPCRTRVIAEGIEATRERVGNKTKLHWEVRDDGTQTGKAFDSLQRLGGACIEPISKTNKLGSFESLKQSQAALEQLVGSYDVWRRSSVFSSSDAAHFSLATDAERKRLLETILGLDAFDVALDRCRADLKTCEQAVSSTSTEVAVCEGNLRHAEARAADAAHALQVAEGDLPAELVAPDPADLTRIGGLVQRSEAELGKLRGGLRSLDATAGAASQELRRAEEAEQRAQQATDTCPTCKQKLPAGKHHVALDLGKLRAQAKDAKLCADDARASAEEAIAELEEDLVQLRSKLSDLQGAQRVAEERARARAQALKARERARLEVEVTVERCDHARTALGGAENAFRTATRRKATLTSVEAVLGLRGVRAHVLGSSLSGLAAVANAWLPRLGLPGLAVTLQPYSEKKTGGVTDSIAVELSGAGGGNGYKGASQGERRRVDLALLLGISEVAGAASGRPNGTMFCDELFDALDADGVKAVSSALVDLACDRTVVVITHNPELVRELPADQRWFIAGGKVSVEG